MVKPKIMLPDADPHPVNPTEPGIITPPPSVDTLIELFYEAQRAFLENQEYMDYQWSMNTLSFEVELPHARLVYPMIPIGTWSPRSSVFTWAFAVNEFPEAARKAATPLKELAQRHGRPEFEPSQFDVSHMEIDELLALSQYVLSSTAVFKEKAMEPWVFFALRPPATKSITSEKKISPSSVADSSAD